MDWLNFGEIHEIDHIVALKQKMAENQKPTVEEITKRFHYTNLQPLWKDENRKWSNKSKSESKSICPILLL